MTEIKKLQRLVKQREKMLEEAKQLYIKADALTKKIGEQIGTKNLVTLPDGSIIEFVDKFETKDVVFAPAACRRYELKIRK